ncbi:hypothetical protein F3Y22_tig00110482pilonHSYRG00041 [Hibiscus syriacus]|uniref:BED-type domain-containing protein n=1 Tax=Hibiscus syriacus TaxID=106335 RepID=A0A6A3AFD3_HIBSY|nr:hypothetical protein F3Y22_tig00110482pilonHSYRG00041 [Hibiscus syriacus]
MDMGDTSDSSTSKSYAISPLTQGSSPDIHTLMPYSSPTPSVSPEPKLIEEVPETATKVAPDDAQNKSSMATMGPSQILPRIFRKFTSPIWNHFEKVTVNGEEKAKCVHCSRYYYAKGKNGTSHLKDHIELRFVNSLNPSFKITTRNTLKSDIMKMFNSEKASLKKLFDGHVGIVAITSDMWTTSNQKKGYMVVTSHFIDDHWILQNKTMRFVYVPCPHIDNMLAQVLVDTLNMYNITEKVSSMVLDNCSTNDAMIDVLQEKFDPDSFLLDVCEIKMTSKKWQDSEEEQLIKDMGEKMIEKFDKYWISTHGILAIAAILDPINKLECVEHYFNIFYGNDASVEIERIKRLLYDLLHKYRDKVSRDSFHSYSSYDGVSLGKRQAGSDSFGSGDEGDTWTQIKNNKKKKVNVRCELDHYPEDDALPESSAFDVFHYWKVDLKYPTLKKELRIF